MKKFMLILSSFVFLSIIGCDLINNSEKGAIAEDEQEINLVLQEDDMVFDEMDEGAESTFGDMDPNWEAPKTMGGDHPFNARPRFGRVITERQKDITVVFETDSTAQAHVSVKFIGKFVSLIPQWSGDSTTADTLTWQRIEKPLEHDVKRIVNFAKYTDQHRDTSRVNPRRRFRWHVTSVSLSEGFSNPSTVKIVELVIKPEGQDEIVISNPLEYFINRKSIASCRRYNEVKIQVKVENLTPNPVEFPEGSGAFENLRIHYGLNRLGNHARKSFEFVGVDDSGYQVYEGTWTIRQRPGVHHTIIDLIDNGSILSPDGDAYPYSSATWSMPYVVTW
jgi:hypothetical protein